MSQAAAAVTTESATRTRSFPITGKQLMSLLGIVPLGAYVVAHLWTNLYSLNGPNPTDGTMSYDEAVRASHGNYGMLFLEIVGLGLPILVHAWVGLQIILKMRPNNARFTTLRNLKYLLQRISGLGLLLFIGAHVVKARIMPAMESRVETWAGMHDALSEPVTFLVYALGLLGVSYHLANGVWSSSITLGLATTPRGFKRMEAVSWLAFAALLAMCGLALYGFHPHPFGGGA